MNSAPEPPDSESPNPEPPNPEPPNPEPPASVPIETQWLDRPVTAVAPDLVGCILVRRWANGRVLRGQIVETEAYGPGDPACHGFRRQTPRNAAMFAAAGIAYVYQIYGLYHCLNVVTGKAGEASAVLIRAVALEQWPEGVISPKPAPLHRLAAGPGKLCRVFDLDRRFNGFPLIAPHGPSAPALAAAAAASVADFGPDSCPDSCPDSFTDPCAAASALWIEHRSARGSNAAPADSIPLVQTTRIGIAHGQDLPWRWYHRDSPAVSKP